MKKTAEVATGKAAPSSRASVHLVGIATAGVLLGSAAQLLRQIYGPLMTLGAATAPWLTIGFLLTLWAMRTRTSSMRTATTPSRAAGLGAALMIAYLFAWVLAYHSMFAVRESAGFVAAWREAAPWILIAVPASVLLGIASETAYGSTTGSAVALALPIAWSLPEILGVVSRGPAHAIVVAVPTMVLALSPFLLLRPGKVVC